MKREHLFILISVFIFWQQNTYCKDVVISLKNEPIEIQNRDFYIEDIIDARINKENIGFAKTGIFNKKSIVKFKTDLKAEILEYLRASLPQNNNQIPIILKITLLKVSERTELTGEYAKAEIKLSFYKRNSDQLGKVFEAEAYYEIPSKWDVTKYHESNIRIVLKQCLEKFAGAGWQNINPVYESLQFVGSQISQSDTTMYAKAPDLGKIKNIVLFGAIKSINASGGNISYYRYYSKSEGWVVPWSFTGNFLKVNNNDKQIKGAFSSFGISIGGFKRINDSNIALFLQGMIPFGNEVIDYGNNNKKTNFFFGVQLSQNIMIIPKSKNGFVFSIGTYQSMLANCDLYPKDFGILGQLGFQF